MTLLIINYYFLFKSIYNKIPTMYNKLLYLKEIFASLQYPQAWLNSIQ